jgi:putative ABC transport system substrate-binding protein
MMRRRAFITLLGGAAAAWPFGARAQAPGKLPTIGVLGTTTRSSWSTWVAAFVQRLSELGWSEGRTVAIEYRWAEGNSERFAEIAVEFARLKVDVIVTTGAGSYAAKRATSIIPIVFAAGGEPVGSGLVASLARPGGNATGLSLQAAGTAGKRLELLREVVPGLRRFAVIAHSDTPAAVLEMREVEAAARTLGLEATSVEVRRAEDIVPALEALKGRAEALYVTSHPLLYTYRIRINTLARLPTISSWREFVEVGSLMSYPTPINGRKREYFAAMHSAPVVMC